MPVEESDYTNDEDDSEDDIVEDLVKSVSAYRADAKTVFVPLVKKATTKWVLIKIPGSSSGGKQIMEEPQSSKGPGPTLKIAKPSKGSSRSFKGLGPKW